MENVNTLPSKSLRERYDEMNAILNRVEEENFAQLEEIMKMLKKEECYNKIKQKIITEFLSSRFEKEKKQQEEFLMCRMVEIRADEFFIPIEVKKDILEEEEKEKAIKQLEEILKEISNCISDELKLISIVPKKQKDYSEADKLIAVINLE